MKDINNFNQVYIKKRMVTKVGRWFWHLRSIGRHRYGGWLTGRNDLPAATAAGGDRLDPPHPRRVERPGHGLVRFSFVDLIDRPATPPAGPDLGPRERCRLLDQAKGADQDQLDRAGDEQAEADAADRPSADLLAGTVLHVDDSWTCQLISWRRKLRDGERNN